MIFNDTEIIRPNSTNNLETMNEYTKQKEKYAIFSIANQRRIVYNKII